MSRLIRRPIGLPERDWQALREEARRRADADGGYPSASDLVRRLVAAYLRPCRRASDITPLAPARQHP